MTDYYELLQISPNADGETIHRVYRYLAARLHPDNIQTGDAEKFQQVKSAYDVLSNATSRNCYDAKRRDFAIQPLSLSIDFMDQLDGETNRRIAVLALLYHRRRTSPTYPEVTLAEIEERMGFPRDYLDFTLWYLVKKGFIGKADNASFTILTDGVDFVERERAERPVLNGLLTSTVGPVMHDPMDFAEIRFTASEDHVEASQKEVDAVPVTPRPVITDARSWVSAWESPQKATATSKEKRRSGKDRRTRASDIRVIKTDRRQNTADRRANERIRRATA